MRDVIRTLTVFLTVVALSAPSSALAWRLPVGEPRSEQAAARGALKVVIIDGDEAANVVQEKMAAESVIEVRDEEDRTVTGAVVRFKIRRAVSKRLSAAFRGGKDEVRTLTDAVGRARTGPLTPLEPGRFEIEVQVTHKGQTATSTIRHTNFSSAAQARAAGREPAQGSNAPAGTQAGAGTAGAGATTAGVAAAGAATAAASAGGGIGLGQLALLGVAVGGAGAGAVVYANSRKDVASAEASLSAITLSQTTGVQAATPFRFSVQATNFAAGNTTYRWEFGDGEASTEAAPTHVYSSAGSYSVSVAVSDGKASARAETSLTVYNVTGNWLSTGGRVTAQFTQTGASITGTADWDLNPGFPPYAGCAITGTVQVGTPAVIVLNQRSCTHPRFGPLVPIDYRLNMTIDGRTLSGTYVQGPGSVNVEGSIALQRQ